jgi:hypothetical protein
VRKSGGVTYYVDPIEHALLELISGVVLVFVGVYVTTVLEHRRERRAKAEETRFRTYMERMDLHSRILLACVGRGLMCGTLIECGAFTFLI